MEENNIIKNNSKSTMHFGILINSNKKNLKINRRDYAKIDKKNHSISSSKREYEKMKIYKQLNDTFFQKIAKFYFDNYLNVFEDETLTTYTDKYCSEHQKDCLINYDLNMNFFGKIKYSDFEKMLSKLRKKFKKLEEIKDLSNYEKKGGLYILILDEYKQIYIGISKDIKKRILQHWTEKKEFSKLIFGNVETSVLSIDSFGALDTTRILVYETDKYKQLELEEKITSYVPQEYLLNRTKGGYRGFSEYELIVNTVGTMNRRKLI